jgi:hypothetical protein
MTINELSTDLLLQLMSYPSNEVLNSAASLSHRYNNLLNDEFWKNKLANEFGLNFETDVTSRFNKLSNKEIYKMLYLFKKRQPITFAWFQQNFIFSGIMIPPLYASFIFPDELENTHLCKFYLDMSAMLNNVELYLFLRSKDVAVDYNTLEYAALSANSNMVELLFDLHAFDSVEVVSNNLGRGWNFRSKTLHRDKLINIVALSGNLPLFKKVMNGEEEIDHDTLINSIRSGSMQLVQHILQLRLEFQQVKFAYVTDQMFSSAALSGSLALVVFLLDIQGINNLKPGNLVSARHNFFISVGKSKNSVLIEWATSTSMLIIWNRLFENNILFIQNDIYQGLLYSGDVDLVKYYKRQWALHFITGNFDYEKFAIAAVKSDNLKCVTWFIKNFPFQSVQFGTDSIQEILSSGAVRVVSQMFAMASKETFLGSDFLLKLQLWKVEKAIITSVNFALIQFISHPDRGVQQILQDDLIQPAKTRRANSHLSMVEKIFANNEELLLRKIGIMETQQSRKIGSSI